MVPLHKYRFLDRPAQVQDQEVVEVARVVGMETAMARVAELEMGTEIVVETVKVVGMGTVKGMEAAEGMGTVKGMEATEGMGTAKEMEMVVAKEMGITAGMAME